MTMTSVLFVDDEPKVLSGLKRSLRTHNLPWRMKFVGSGADALERLKEQPFDVVVSDLKMPAMSGEELLEQVSHEYPQIVQVILTGVKETELDRTKLTGAVPQFLPKPCSAEKLISTIQRGIFLREFFRRGALNRLIDSLADLTSFPELQIRIRPADESREDNIRAVAEILCHDLGLRLRIPVRRTDTGAALMLEGADR